MQYRMYVRTSTSCATVSALTTQRVRMGCGRSNGLGGIVMMTHNQEETDWWQPIQHRAKGINENWNWKGFQSHLGTSQSDPTYPLNETKQSGVSRCQLLMIYQANYLMRCQPIRAIIESDTITDMWFPGTLVVKIKAQHLFEGVTMFSFVPGWISSYPPS